MNGNEELRKLLTKEELALLQDDGTEVPFSDRFYAEHPDGIYICRVCSSALFPSTAKFHSDIGGLRGWPSFDDALPGER